MRSPIYWHPVLYNAAMRLAYGAAFRTRYVELAATIPDGVSVHEVCAGNFYLFRHALRNRQIDYSGSDLNAGFVRAAQARGIRAQRIDIRHDAIPGADYIIMHAGLYQFIPQHAPVVDALLARSRRGTIIAEPIVNFSSSNNRLVAYVAQRLADPGSGPKHERFTEQTLDEFVLSRYPGRVTRTIRIAHGREKVYILAAGPIEPHPGAVQ